MRTVVVSVASAMAALVALSGCTTSQHAAAPPVTTDLSTSSDAPLIATTSPAPVTSTAGPGVTATSPATRTATVASPASTPATHGTLAVPAGLVGAWSGHGRGLTIHPDGSVHLTFRTYTWCSATLITGCDGTPTGTLHDGGQVTGQITVVHNATTVTVMISSTSVPADVPLGPTRLGEDTRHDAIALFAGRLSGTPFCGNNAPRDYCGA